MREKIKFRNNFINHSNKIIDKIIKHKSNKAKAIKIDSDLGCYKNFIIHFFDKKKIITMNLYNYYIFLPSNILLNRDLLFKALLELNDDGYILIKKDLFRLMIINNEKKWIDIPCKNNLNHDLKEIIETENTISKVKLTNEDITTLDNRIFTMLMNDDKEIVPVKNITSGQVDLIDKMNVIQNIMINVFINMYIDKAKDTLDAKKIIILKELNAYNIWTLKNKQDQFYSEDIEADHTIFIKHQIDKHIKEDVKNSIIEKKPTRLTNNYFDKNMNLKIEKQIKILFKEKGWPNIKKEVLNNYFAMFSFI